MDQTKKLAAELIMLIITICAVLLVPLYLADMFGQEKVIQGWAFLRSLWSQLVYPIVGVFTLLFVVTIIISIVRERKQK
jgi:hypothetical protein